MFAVIILCIVVTSALDWLECSSQMGKNVTMTFYFAGDISNDHEIDGFSVLRYRHQVLDDIEPVVDCIWFRPRNLRCLEKPGYTLIQPITDTVVIVIKNYNLETHEGFYTCHASSNQQLVTKKCKFPLHLKDEQTGTYTQTPTPHINVTTGQQYIEQQEGCNDRGTDINISIVAILSSVNVLTLVVLSCVLFFMIKRRQMTPVHSEKQYCDHRSGNEIRGRPFEATLLSCAQTESLIPSHRKGHRQDTMELCCTLESCVVSAPVEEDEEGDIGVSLVPQKGNGLKPCSRKRHVSNELPLGIRQETMKLCCTQESCIVSAPVEEDEVGDIRVSLVPQKGNCLEEMHTAVDIPFMCTEESGTFPIRKYASTQGQGTIVFGAQQFRRNYWSGDKLRDSRSLPTLHCWSQKESVNPSRYLFDRSRKADFDFREFPLQDLKKDDDARQRSD